MACYHPIKAWRSRAGRNPATGAWPIVFDRKEGYHDMEITIPCGRCIGCRLERSRQWAVRISHEASTVLCSCFITLTYDDDHLPVDQSLIKKDMQLFFKRLRKYYKDSKIRYFMCGEYGEQLNRPHYHACIFNLDFSDDRKYYKTVRRNKYFISENLNRLWGHGFCIVTDLTFEGAAYVARYCTKKITGEMAKEHYGGRLPEYCTMSRARGIGRDFWDRFKQDIIVGDTVIIRSDMKVRPARFYDKLYDIENPEAHRRLKNKRLKKAQANPENFDANRLAVKEKIQMYKFSKLKRSFENAQTEIVLA